MRKIATVSFLVLSLSGCLSPTQQLCEESQACNGTVEDPQAWCADKEEASREEWSEECAAAQDAMARCLLQNGECKDAAGGKSFGFKADVEQDVCNDEGSAILPSCD